MTMGWGEICSDKRVFGHARYNLVVKNGVYYSDEFLGLFWAVMTHRLWHLFTHRRWID